MDSLLYLESSITAANATRSSVKMIASLMILRNMEKMMPRTNSTASALKNTGRALNADHSSIIVDSVVVSEVFLSVDA